MFLKNMCDNFINKFVEKCIEQLEEKITHYEFVYIDDERGSKIEYEPRIQKSIDFNKTNMIEKIMDSR